LVVWVADFFAGVLAAAAPAAGLLLAFFVAGFFVAGSFAAGFFVAGFFVALSFGADAFFAPDPARGELALELLGCFGCVSGLSATFPPRGNPVAPRYRRCGGDAD
jgi:hypothetical protein